MLHNYDSYYPQPIIGSRTFQPAPGAPIASWLLYIHNTSLVWGGLNQSTSGAWAGSVELDKWHFAVVRNGYVKMDNRNWSYNSSPVVMGGAGQLGHCLFWNAPLHAMQDKYLDGKMSMYYASGTDALTDAQIDMFYERTRRLHGV